MNELMINSKISDFDFIEKIEDKSDFEINMTRMRIHFKNGFQLSVIQGQFSYGGDQGLFEIAVYDLENCMTDLFFDDELGGDDVLGYLTKEEVISYILKVGEWKINKGEQ